MTIEYLAVYGLADKPESPSSVVRRIKSDDPPIYTISICNSRATWREDPDLIRYFMGINDNGYSVTAEEAEKFIKPWRENWTNKKETIRKKDLQRIITVYDMMGRVVKTLVNSSQSAGYKFIQ